MQPSKSPKKAQKEVGVGAERVGTRVHAGAMGTDLRASDVSNGMHHSSVRL